MAERIYASYPELYDAIQSGWDYDRDVSFVRDALERHDVAGDRLLEVGCGTGEHTRRFAAAGFEVTAVDPYAGMLGSAREKCDADFRRAALPDLAVDGSFDAAVAIRGVVNHLPPEHLEPALRAVHERLRDDGLFVFDNSPLPPDGNRPDLDVGRTERGRYARVVRMRPRADDRLDWQTVLFAPDGDVVVNTRPMTPFDDGTIVEALDRAGFAVDTHEGFGRGDDRTVFVAVA